MEQMWFSSELTHTHTHMHGHTSGQIYLPSEESKFPAVTERYDKLLSEGYKNK